MDDRYIAIFSGYILPHLGGIERYIDSLIKEFNKLNYKVILVTSNYNDSKYEEMRDRNIILRLPVYQIFKNRYPILRKNKIYKALMAKLNYYNIDSIIVNTRFHLTSHIGANYGKKRNIPVYLIEHGSNYVTLNNKFIDFFANRYEDFLTFKIKNKINKFYGVSKACSDWLNHFKIKSSGVWYNSIDINQDLPRKNKHMGVNFMYAGRIIKQKGVENILNAFTKLQQEYKNIHLYIAGDGPELDDYKKGFNSSKITYLGKLNYDELKKYYAKTDVFLYPPLWPEGLPTSILEAGLMSCAVIGTNQGGIKEIIKNKKNGIIVDDNINSLYNAMKELLVDKNKLKKYSVEINKTIKEKFSWGQTAKKVLGDISER